MEATSGRAVRPVQRGLGGALAEVRGTSPPQHGMQERLGFLAVQEPDWEGWAVCCNSPAVPGGSGAHTTGEPAACARRSASV